MIYLVSIQHIAIPAIWSGHVPEACAFYPVRVRCKKTVAYPQTCSRATSPRFHKGVR